MSEYVLDHHYKGERGRLASMSELLDPMHRRHIERLGVGPGARTLEVGCGNGYILLIEPDFLPVTIGVQLRDRLEASGKLDRESIDTFLLHCGDPGWWTQTIAFTAVAGRTPKDRLDG